MVQNNNDNNINLSSSTLYKNLIQNGDAIKYIDNIIGINNNTSSSSLTSSTSSTSPYKVGGFNLSSLNQVDLLERPHQLESSISSIVSILINLKKSLNNTVQNELDKSNSNNINLGNLREEILELEEKKKRVIESIEDKEQGILSTIKDSISYNHELKERLSSVDTLLSVLDYFIEYEQLIRNYEQSHQSKQYLSSSKYLLAMEEMLSHTPVQLIDDIEIHYAKKKRNNLIVKAREIILNEKFNHINSNDSILGALIEATQSPMCAESLYQGSRDIFELLMGNLRTSKLKLNNDNLCTFIDLSPKFKELGNEFFSKYLNNQLQHILSYMDNCNRLENTKDPAIYQRIESNFKRMINELSKLSDIWKLTFPREEYFELVSKFVESIISNMIKMVLNLQNIEVIETTRLCQLSSLFLSFEQIFLFQGESDDLTKSRMKLVKSWKKLWQLNKVLEMSLSEIVNHYNKGLLSKLSNNELRLMILSIFDDFDLRTTFLNQLSKSK
eukprot:gene10066-12338_t